jgi:hypothetical protein
MAQHRLIDCHAPGYWGSDPHDRVDAEYVADKVLSGNLDKILAMGLPYALWRGASFMRDGLQTCSCFKDTSKQPDIPCLSCYGTGIVPGYFKFGTRNYWTASIDSGWTLSNIILDKVNRPFRFMLAPAALSGTAISPDLAISVTGKIATCPWEAKAEAFTRDGGANSTVVVEASKDSGLTWFSLSAIDAQSPTATLMFKVTMTRTSVDIKTPMFEIVRARFGTYTDISNRITTEPVIRVVPTWLNEAELREKYGGKMEARGNRFWTVPMAFFDSSLQLDEPRSRISDDAFVEVRYGGENGYRYALVDFSYSDTFDKFTRQEFTCRKVTGQPGHIQGEHWYRIW